jgi:CubicO group peptidase (beta-lactamase class C family)
MRVRANGRDFDPGITIPNGGWNAPLADLATYAAFLTNASLGAAAKERLYDVVIKRSTLEEMWRPVAPYSGTGKTGDAIGLSFFIHPRGEATIIGHTGSQAGFRAFLFVNPKSREAIIVAYNTTNYSRSNRGRESGEVMELALTLLARG